MLAPILAAIMAPILAAIMAPFESGEIRCPMGKQTKTENDAYSLKWGFYDFVKENMYSEKSLFALRNKCTNA